MTDLGLDEDDLSPGFPLDQRGQVVAGDEDGVATSVLVKVLLATRVLTRRLGLRGTSALRCVACQPAGPGRALVGPRLHNRRVKRTCARTRHALGLPKLNGDGCGEAFAAAWTVWKHSLVSGPYRDGD